MSLLFGHDKAVADWVSSKVGKEFHAPYTSIGIVSSEGRLTGGFVFNSYTQDGINMSLAGDVAKRGVWVAVADYVFKQLGCSRLAVQTRRSNKIVKKLAPRLGFKFEGIARNYYGKEDGFVYSMTKDDLPAFFQKWGIKNGF